MKVYKTIVLVFEVLILLLLGFFVLVALNTNNMMALLAVLVSGVVVSSGWCLTKLILLNLEEINKKLSK